MSDYQKELDYQLSILKATALRSKGEDLARGLFDYHYSHSLSVLDRAGLIESLVALASEIQSDLLELDAFKWQWASLNWRARRAGQAPVDGVTDFLQSRCNWLGPYLQIQYNELVAKATEYQAQCASAA